MRRFLSILICATMIVACKGVGGEKLEEDQMYAASQTVLGFRSINGIETSVSSKIAQAKQIANDEEAAKTLLAAAGDYGPVTTTGFLGGKATVSGTLKVACGLISGVQVKSDTLIVFENYEYETAIYETAESKNKTNVVVKVSGNYGILFDIKAAANGGYVKIEFADKKGLDVTITEKDSSRVIVDNKKIFSLISYDYNTSTEKETYTIKVNSKTLKYDNFQAFAEANLGAAYAN